MKLYLLIYQLNFNQADDTYGIFSTKEKAIKCLKENINQAKVDDFRRWCIEEYILDKDFTEYNQIEFFDGNGCKIKG